MHDTEQAELLDRPLTAVERDRIAKGLADFAAGRWYDEEEVDRYLDALDLDPNTPLPPVKSRAQLL